MSAFRGLICWKEEDMLTERIKNINKFRKNPFKRLDIRDRHERLLNIEGWYETPPLYSNLPPILRVLHDDYLKSNSRLKYTKWLSRHTSTSPDEIARIGILLKTVKFKISCRHNDLLRLADTTHYKSCFKEWRGTQQLRFLADPDMGVVFIPDASGKFLWRALIRLIIDPITPNSYGLVIYRDYGNTNKTAVFEKINEMIPVYLPVLRNDMSSQIVKSPTIHNNAIIGTNVWTDHWCALDKNKMIRMNVIKFTPGMREAI